MWWIQMLVGRGQPVDRGSLLGLKAHHPRKAVAVPGGGREGSEPGWCEGSWAGERENRRRAHEDAGAGLRAPVSLEVEGTGGGMEVRS